MKFQLCENDHVPIKHSDPKGCPLCSALQRVSDLGDEVTELEATIEEMTPRRQLDYLEATHVENLIAKLPKEDRFYIERAVRP